MRLISFIAALALLAPSAFGEPITEAAQIDAPNPGSNFGVRLGMSGSALLISDDSEDAILDDLGAASVYRYTDNTGTPEVHLLPPDAEARDRFGFAVGISGDVLAVGTARAEAVYVHRNNGTDWVYEATLTAPMNVESFGRNVAIDGDVIAASVWRGEVFVFRHTGSVWVFEQRLSTQAATSHAIDPNRIVVGSAGPDVAEVYLYDVSMSAWLPEGLLEPSDAGPQDNTTFATSVGISGNRIIVGDSWNDDNRGAAYVYRFDGASWNEEQKLISSDNRAVCHVSDCDEFGISVAIQGSHVVVGSFHHEHGDALSDSGSAYLYRQDGLTWVEEAEFLASNPTLGASFGISAAIDGNVIAIGAFDNGYLFTVAPTQPATTRSTTMGTA